MNRWVSMTLSIATILALSGCDGWTTPSDTDSITQCIIKQVNTQLSTNSAIVNSSCTDNDGLQSAKIIIDSQSIDLSFPNDATSFDINTTVNNLSSGSNFTAQLEVLAKDGTSGEYEINTFEGVVRTVTPTPEDTQAPVLSSTNQTFTSSVWTTIVLETVTATDNIDGAVTVVQTWDTPDSTTAWTYEVIYTATDAAGNESSITHTYIVEASSNIAPTLSLSLSGSNFVDNWNNNFRSETGWIITFDMSNSSDSDWNISRYVIQGIYDWQNSTFTMDTSWKTYNSTETYSVEVYDDDWAKSSTKIITIIYDI